MCSNQVVTVFRKRRQARRKQTGAAKSAGFPADDLRWTSRTEILIFAVIALLVIWPLMGLAEAIGSLHP
jgi:hypothetical protein